ncbi:PfkB family carbohydrate kinase [Pectinatus frisingensis]|uniref:PfkB family carbohydrate kinase n=1 Tax=Pectinatus frisingensis TaxID=865 RepID=UPI0018C74F10|nr:PfkB family carbohydrate kinase [Pectinatus frisingensis]
MKDDKIIDKKNFLALRQKFRKEGKKVVLCHGVFDLLHYGHIEHLQEARAQGDILVVSVTAAKYVNKGPGRPYFNDNQRMAFLSSLEIVDYVILSEAVTVHEIIKYVQPDIYVKGQEYIVAANDITGNIGSEQQIVEKYGGKIYFTKGAIYSSTKLLNNFFGALPENVIEKSRYLREKYGVNITKQIHNMVESFSDLRVLVIGDIIIDEYVFCNVQGLTTKDAAMSTRYDFQERYAGGALAIARHLANFAGKVTLLSMMGNESNISKYIYDIMAPVECRIVQEPHFITPMKKRYLKRHPLRQEYEKLFSVNRLLDSDSIRMVKYDNFYRNLDQLISQYDLVVVCDYGHGLLNNYAIRKIEKDAKYLAVNCQANSSNFGMNIITKYHRANCFVVDERELHLPFGQSTDVMDNLLKRLNKKLDSEYAWVTLGANGALGLNNDEQTQIPAVTLHVKDTVGAGDAFYSLAALGAVKKMPIDLITLLSNVAGAIKTNLVGNSKPVGKIDLLKFVNTILNV